MWIQYIEEAAVLFHLWISTLKRGDDCSRDSTTHLIKVLVLLALEDGGLVDGGALTSVVNGLAFIADVVTLSDTVLASAIIQVLILSLPNSLWLDRLGSLGDIGLLFSLLFALNASRLGAVAPLARNFG